MDQILTTDGIPLKVSLRKTERKNKIRAFLLVFPLLLFIIVTFIVPIADMLLRSVDDSQINEVYTTTFEEYKKWSPNAMYVFAIGIPFAFAVATGSQSMFVVAIYTYISIWLHYFCTEKEDFKVIYQGN